jgi:hypothetical protein
LKETMEKAQRSASEKKAANAKANKEMEAKA